MSLQVRPPVWRMVKEAVKALGGKTTNVAVRDWILKKYPGTNRGTISCQIIVCTVNHASRIHYPCNQRRRNAAGKYDCLFTPRPGDIELYDPVKHGRWEIRQLPGGKFAVAQTEKSPEPNRSETRIPTTDVVERQATPDKHKRPLKASSEKEWVIGLAPRVEIALQAVSTRNVKARVAAHRRLPYTREVLAYHGDEPKGTRSYVYETDLMIYDQKEDDTWIPRVIIECKMGSITTHDALTYSAKAATHKQVHPYLRYGILIGSWGDAAFPVRLFRHGAYFDFMATWADCEPMDEEWNGFVDILISETRASRKIGQMLSKQRESARNRLKLVHRPLKFK